MISWYAKVLYNHSWSLMTLDSCRTEICQTEDFVRWYPIGTAIRIISTLYEWSRMKCVTWNIGEWIPFIQWSLIWILSLQLCFNEHFLSNKRAMQNHTEYVLSLTYFSIIFFCIMYDSMKLNKDMRLNFVASYLFGS